RDRHVVGHVAEDGRPHEPAGIETIGTPFAARDQPRALVDTDADIALHALPLLLADHRADGRARIAWIARLRQRHFVAHTRLELREALARHQNARTRDARLTAVHEARIDRERHDLVEVRVVEHDG